SSTSTQFRPAQPVVPSPRSDVRRKEATSTRTVVQLPFCMKSVREKLGDYCELSQQPLSRETTLVIGRLPNAPKEGWLVCHKGKLATLNITCLRETALFRKLKQTYVVQAEELRPPLVVTASASDSVAVEEVRPPSVLELLKRESKRMVQGSVPSPPEDVRNGAEELDELCLHGNAICAAFFDTKDVANT
ncbi:unnamed protein product, partial [Ixodes pacificus]